MLPEAVSPCPGSRRMVDRKTVRMGWVPRGDVSCYCEMPENSRIRLSDFVDFVRVEEVVQELWWHQKSKRPDYPSLPWPPRFLQQQCLIVSQLAWDRGWLDQWRRRADRRTNDRRAVATACCWWTDLKIDVIRVWNFLLTSQIGQPIHNVIWAAA